MKSMCSWVYFSLNGRTKNAFERVEGAGEAFFAVVNSFRTSQGERPAALAEGDLVAEDLAAERRLLDVARSGRDSELAECSGKSNRAARDDTVVNSQAVLPERVDCSV